MTFCVFHLDWYHNVNSVKDFTGDLHAGKCTRYGQKYADTWTITPLCGSSRNCFHRVRSTQSYLYEISVRTVRVKFPFTGTKERQTCSNMTVSFWTKLAPWDMWVWMNFSGLHRALTSTPLNTFGMKWNAFWESGLLVQDHFLTLLMLLWLNERKSQQPCF